MPGFPVYQKPGAIKRLEPCAKCEKPRRCVRRLECALEVEKAAKKAERQARKEADVEIQEGLLDAINQ